MSGSKYEVETKVSILEEDSGKLHNLAAEGKLKKSSAEGKQKRSGDESEDKKVVELSMNLREVSQCLFKAPTSTFTIKNLLGI